jgi:hypothetical protein
MTPASGVQHLITKGECRETMKVIKKLIVDGVKQSPNAKICDIQLVANKVFITTPSCKAQ